MDPAPLSDVEYLSQNYTTSCQVHVPSRFPLYFLSLKGLFSEVRFKLKNAGCRFLKKVKKLQKGNQMTTSSLYHTQGGRGYRLQMTDRASIEHKTNKNFLPGSAYFCLYSVVLACFSSVFRVHYEAPPGDLRIKENPMISMNLSSDFQLNFQPDQPAQIVDSELKSALKTKEAAHLCSLEWFGEILNRKLYLELGYSSINQYAREELNFRNSKIGDYLKLTKKIEKLPELKKSLSEGEIGYTKGRLIVDVADETNEKLWTEFAKNNTRNKLETEVRRAKKEAHDEAARQPSFLPEEKRKAPAAVVPVRVNIEMTPSQYARYENAWQQIRKIGNVSAEKVEALLEIMESYLNSDFQDASSRGENCVNSRPPAQIHIHHCPECESSIVQTNKGELEIGVAEYERYRCDCQISTLNGKNKTSIPPATRRKVLAAARHKCQTPGCHHTQFLEIHHIIPRAEGGSNELSNLMVVCSACHARIHAHGMRGRPEKHETRETHGNHSVVKSPLAFYCWNQATGLRI